MASYLNLVLYGTVLTLL